MNTTWLLHHSRPSGLQLSLAAKDHQPTRHYSPKIFACFGPRCAGFYIGQTDPDAILFGPQFARLPPSRN